MKYKYISVFDNWYVNKETYVSFYDQIYNKWYISVPSFPMAWVYFVTAKRAQFNPKTKISI
jgi:hypothetical protein